MDAVAVLDDNQREAVEAGPVDLFVSAGAGSGKTRVLSARFVAAVTGEAPYKACDPRSVLTITYTERAAAELAERIRKGLSAAGDLAAARASADAWISTIHGMCSRVLRQHAFDAGIDPHFAVLDTTDTTALEIEAFEEAASSLILADPEVECLHELYGHAETSRAVRAAYASVRALGGGAEDLAVTGERASKVRLAEIARAASSLAEEFMSLRQTKTVGENAAGARAVADALAGMDADVPDEAVTAAAGLIGAVRFTRRTDVEGQPELVDEARELQNEALACARQVEVAPFERAFLRLAAEFARRYEDSKRQRGALDFEDLQVLTARLFERRPDITAHYRSRFAMLMIDEFQDTNALQVRIVERISDGNLCTVGDENQSIYRFRHADVEVFRRRARDVKTRVALDANYRTAPELLGAVNGLFSHPALLGPGFMQLRAPEPAAERGAWPAGWPLFQVRFIDGSVASEATRQEIEAEEIAGHIADLIAAGVEPASVAVLLGVVRGGAGRAVEAALVRRGVPAVLAAGGAFWDCAEVVQLRALLRVVDNVRDDEALLAVLAGHTTGLSDDALLAIRSSVATGPRGGGRPSLWECATCPDLALGATDRALLDRTLEAVGRARQLRGIRPLGELVESLVRRLELDLVLLSRGAEGGRAWANVLKLVRMAAEYEAITAGDLRGFLEHLDLRCSVTETEEEATLVSEGDAVRIMSIHASKGLEFPVVVLGSIGRSWSARGRILTAKMGDSIVVGMRHPTAATKEADTYGYRLGSQATRAAEEEEAKRLLYVGCTRAREHLAVVMRTDPAKEADGTDVGLVREALGMAAEGGVVPGVRPIGDGVADVTLSDPAPAIEHPAGPASVPEAPVTVPGPMAGHLPAVVPGMPTRVSYTALSDYTECPFRFYLQRIARLAPPPAETGTGARRFGSAVHAVLERCGDDAATLDRHVAAVASAERLEAATTRRLHEVTAAYLGSPVARTVASAERVMREVPIAVPLGRTVLVGAIDVLARRGGDALIVDYKTGDRALTPSAAEDAYRLQGQCYALAALVAGARRVEVVFAELERGRETSFTYASDERSALLDEVARHVELIAEGRFEPLEAYDRAVCEDCPGLGSLCPVTRVPRGSAG